MATGIRNLSLPSLLNKYIIARLTLNLSKPFFLIIGAEIALILATLIWVSIRWRYNRKRKVLETQLVSEGRELKIEYIFLRKVAGVPTKFRFKELKEAMDSFRTILGQGPSGCVFKKVSIDGTCVVVKMIEGKE